MRLIKFESTWCGACKKQDKYMDMVEKQTGVKCESINIEVDPSLAQQLGIKTLPSVVLFDRNNLIYVWQGLTPTQQIVNIIMDNN